MAAAAASMASDAASAPAARAVQTIVNGQNIFVYTHLRTRQTVYSLTRSMWAKKALKQLTFAGKKSVPGGIRKDFWRPLCVLSFPRPEQGLDAYHKMREFKLLHETAWDRDEMSEHTTTTTSSSSTSPAEGNEEQEAVRSSSGKLKHWKERRKAIMDQKANSIADMAAVLSMQATAPTAAEVAKARWWMRRPIVTLAGGRKAPAPDRPKRGMGKKDNLGRIEWQGDVRGVTIHWTDLVDAEFAESWPADVLHAQLDVNRHTAVWPPADAVAVAGGGEGATRQAGSGAEVDGQAAVVEGGDAAAVQTGAPKKSWLGFGRD